MEEKTITISKAAKILNITNRTLRYYESIGLINPPQKGPDNKYRKYTKEDVDNLKKVLFLKNIGLSLTEVKEYLKNKDKTSLEKSLQEQSVKLEAVKRIIKGIAEVGKSIGVDAKFKNDPALLGLWKFEGSAKTIADFQAGNMTDTFYPYKKLCFKPNGGSSWFYSWNKGIIIFNTWYVPEFSKYKIQCRKLFIKIQNPSEHSYIDNKSLKTSTLPEVIVFSKIKTENITAEDVFYYDNTNLPFKADKKAIGVWKLKDSPMGIIISDGGAVYEFGKPNSEKKLFGAVELSHTKDCILDLTNNVCMGYRVTEEKDRVSLTLEKKGKIYKNTGLIEGTLIFEKLF